MGAFALSGEVVERQFYIKIWDRVSDGVERDLLQKLKLLGGYFSDSGIQTEILEQQDIVRLPMSRQCGRSTASKAAWFILPNL